MSSYHAFKPLEKDRLVNIPAYKLQHLTFLPLDCRENLSRVHHDLQQLLSRDRYQKLPK